MQNPNAVEPDYGFIVNPAQAPMKKLSLFGGGSLLTKVALIGGALVLIMIVGVTVKSLTSKPSGTAYFVAIAQDQQAIIHVSGATATQQNISTKTLNSAVTVNSSIKSAQSNLLAYIALSKSKPSPAQLNAKVSKTTDTQLTNAVGAGTYDSTYASVMNTLLETYSKDLKIAFSHTTGPKGKALLTSEYNDAQLLIKQLAN